MPAQDIEADAAAWLIRLDGDPSQSTRTEFEAWIAAHAQHRAAFMRLEKTWARADILKKLRPLDGKVDKNLTNRFDERRPAPSVPTHPSPWPAAATAAGWRSIRQGRPSMPGSRKRRRYR